MNPMTNILADPPAQRSVPSRGSDTLLADAPRPVMSRWAAWSDRKWLWLLFGLALVVRLGFVLLPPIWNRALRWGDEWNYDELATVLLTKGYFGYGHSGPTVFRPPLYPALMASLYALFGQHAFGPIYVVQALCGAACAPILARIGQRITGSLAVGLVAGVLFTFAPLLVLITAVLYMETVYLLLLLGTVLMCLHLVRSEGLPKNWLALAVGSGLLFGVGLLMRPTFFAVVPPLFFVWAWVVLRRVRQAALVTAVVTVCTFAVVLPWSVRNGRVPKRPGRVHAGFGERRPESLPGQQQSS
jgi:4-amino-4-deoxy-L-arabinose transferase-like glycosyltransferase